MARGALAGVGTFQELAVVRVLVAVGALGEFQRFFEIAIGMAGSALDRLMFAFERILGFGVIEILSQSLGDALPSQGGVAGGAGLLETAVMRILMAVVAFAEGKTLVARLAIGAGCMTLFALHLLVLSGERIAGLGVIEGLRDVFPVVEIVAGLALLTEASLVEILMAGAARSGNADEAPVQILHLDPRSLAC